MMDFEQKKNIGFIYLLERLSPKSGFGKRALKSVAPYKDEASLRQELFNVSTALSYLKKDSDAFKTLDGILAHVKDIGGSISRIGDDITETELFELKSFCSLCEQVIAELARLKLKLKGLSFVSLKSAFDILNLSDSVGFYISDNHSPALAKLREQKRAYATAMVKASGSEREELRLRHLELSAKEEEEEFRLRRELSKKLIPYAENMRKNAGFIAMLDLILEKAALAQDCNGIIPVIEDRFELDRAVNPYICDLLQNEGKEFSAITLSLSGVTVITGANMGGKTVALKTVALNAYAAMCGFPVFASAATLPFLDFVEIVSEDLQSSERGLSSFGGEVIKINGLYEKAKKSRGLLLIDEFASGTNYEEGAKIFSALLRALKTTPALSLLTTHFDGVCKDATARYQIIGLSKDAKEKLRNRSNVSKENIAEFMNYGLIKTDRLSEIPKDALDICAILGLSDDILALVEK